MQRAWLRPTAALLVATAAMAGRAYDEPTHQLIGERALAAGLPGELAAVRPSDLAALRQAVWEAGAHHADAAIRTRFLARFPDPAGFDGWALKELVGLTPEAAVVGLDLAPPDLAEARQAMAAGSRQPDADRRNQERFAHGADRQVRRDRWDRPLPADPAQLDMGKLTGLSSQAHAHYGLPRLEFSDDPAVLERDPRRFAWPPTARAFAADFAQAHTDLALAAATLGTPGGRALSYALLGQAEHYLEDVANQVHTLQAVYPFFVDAKLASVKEDLLTLGGLLGSRRGFVPMGIQLISNHHLFAEALWSRRMQEAAAGAPRTPEVAAGLAALAAGDPALEGALDGRRLDRDGPFARVIGEELIDASSREGAEVYLAAREVARPRLSDPTYEFADGGDPDADLAPEADRRRLARFYELEGHGFARAGTALRRHLGLFREAVEAAGGSEASRLALRRVALGRLVADGLVELQAREARLAAWTPAPPARAAVDWRYAAGLAAVLGLVAAAVSWRRRRSGRWTHR